MIKLLRAIINLLPEKGRLTARRLVRIVREWWYRSEILNSIRRYIQPCFVKVKNLFTSDKTPIRLNLGCGDMHLRGFINIDWRKTSATDLVCDIKKLPYKNNSVERIETYHVIEHFLRHDVLFALKEWNRVLKQGGILVIECPDFDVAVKEYLDGNEKRMDNIFGLARFPGDIHLFGYNYKRLENMLLRAGFISIKQMQPQDYHTKEEPCMRIECRK